MSLGSADKRRPVLVVTRDPMGRLLHSVICAPITSKIRGISTEVALGEDAGLATTMEAACRALATAIGCASPSA